MRDFRELLASESVFVFDGAMGTRLYDKGIYINRSYDELNIAAPDLVREVHEEYVNAGADIIETNTFGAIRPKLQPYGLESRLREINIAAARLAREAAGERVFVAGAIGPLGLRIEPFGPTSFDEAKDIYREQAEALLEGGIDLFILETFSELSVIEQAIRRTRAVGSADRCSDDHPGGSQNDIWHLARGFHDAARRTRRGRDRAQLRHGPDARAVGT